MPNIKSAKRRVKTSARNELRNVAQKSEYRGALVDVKKAIAAGDEKAAKEKMSLAQKLVDQAVQKNVIHLNKAKRLLSRLAKQYTLAFKK